MPRSQVHRQVGWGAQRRQQCRRQPPLLQRKPLHPFPPAATTNPSSAEIGGQTSSTGRPRAHCTRGPQALLLSNGGSNSFEVIYTVPRRESRADYPQFAPRQLPHWAPRTCVRTGLSFELNPPPFRDIQSGCRVRCPRCLSQVCRRNRSEVPCCPWFLVCWRFGAGVVRGLFRAGWLLLVRQQPRARRSTSDLASAKAERGAR